MVRGTKGSLWVLKCQQHVGLFDDFRTEVALDVLSGG